MAGIVVALLASLAVLMLFSAVFGGRRESPTIRLQRIAVGGGTSSGSSSNVRSLRGSVLTMRTVVNLNRLVERKDWGANMARELARADLTLRPTEYLAIRAGSFIGMPFLAFLLGATIIPAFGNGLAWVVAAVIGWWLPGFWVGRRKGKRLKAFNSHLADTITLIANALRAGASFLQAIEMVQRETQPPISTEFGRVIREVNLGLPFEQALANMVRRVRSEDLELMTTAITIQHQVGGNLAEILDSIAFTIRERIRIKGEIRTLTAQQRMSGYVVGGLPIFLVLILNVIAPTFMEPMFMKPPEMFGLPMGVIILALGGVMMALGFILIRRIVDIEV